jgi:hypothetical protein
VVAEGSLALAIRIAGERAGTLAAQARHVPEAADRIVGADAAKRSCGSARDGRPAASGRAPDGCRAEGRPG